MKINVKITIGDEQGRFFMGSGLAWLLEGIERHRSISAAAREMNLSYPKALKMIRNIEGGLGHQIVLRHKGGNKRGGAELTPVGEEFLRRFRHLQQLIWRFADDNLKDVFATPFTDSGAG